VLFSLFLGALAAQSVTGWHDYNQDRADHGVAGVSYSDYLGSGHFIEAVFENWESEFLQISSYVLLTIYLRQKGSSESKKLSGQEDVDRGRAGLRAATLPERSAGAAGNCVCTRTRSVSPSSACSSSPSCCTLSAGPVSSTGSS
jgi:hypothetical protein